MSEEKAYDLLYQNMNNGLYNKIVRTWEKNLAPSSEISVDLVTKACKKQGVNFGEFLKYAQKRKKGETE